MHVKASNRFKTAELGARGPRSALSFNSCLEAIREELFEGYLLGAV